MIDIEKSKALNILERWGFSVKKEGFATKIENQNGSEVRIRHHAKKVRYGFVVEFDKETKNLDGTLTRIVIIKESVKIVIWKFDSAIWTQMD